MPLKSKIVHAVVVTGALVALCGVVACADQTHKTVRPALALKKVEFSDLPGFASDDMAGALTAFQKSCAALMKKDPQSDMGVFAGRAAQWQGVCEKTALLMLGTDDEARNFFVENFTPYAVYGQEGDNGLFTGYYEPVLRGALEKKPPYLTPLYARPASMKTVDLGLFSEDLKGRSITARIDGDKIVPYFTRAEIEDGALSEEQGEIVWVDSPVDAFFLHIQGSGRVEMEDGSVLRVGYAAQNGHAYLAIGKELIARGALTKETVSMQSIRQWLEENPADAPAVMNLNASYIFFKPLEGDGPLGAQGVALTPARSMAVDKKIMPYGLPLYLDAQGPTVQDAPLQRLMIAQDTGGAIKGAVRGDYFWGAGPDAAENAGVMKSKGRYFALLPKDVVVPDAYQWHWWKNFWHGKLGMKGYNP